MSPIHNVSGFVNPKDGNHDDLLSMALELHMTITGASLDSPPNEIARIVDVLSNRLHSWRPSVNGCERFDSAVYILIKVALDEYEQSHLVDNVEPLRNKQ